MLRGLKTLAVRVRPSIGQRFELARRLAAHAMVERVRYPGLGPGRGAATVQAFGPLLSFDVALTRRQPPRVERSLRRESRHAQPALRRRSVDARGPAPGEEGRTVVPPGLLRLSVRPRGLSGSLVGLNFAAASGRPLRPFRAPGARVIPGTGTPETRG